MKALGLYIHIPFCVKKCNYCDFNSFCLNSFDMPEALINQYMEALHKEAEIQSEAVRQLGAQVVTIYLGGGTPTCLPEESLLTLLTEIFQAYPVARDAEVTVECNPRTVDHKKLRRLRDTGVTRLSIGVQSLDDSLLARLGRAHSALDAVEVFYLARKVGFDNINIDLIYAIPDQTMKDWEETLDLVMELEPEHISSYGLMLEEGTPLWNEVRAGAIRPCDEDCEIAMYYLAKDRLKRAGYEHYEISNFALPGFKCRHNIIYWRLAPYISLGAGAHSYVGRERWSNLKDPGDYRHSIMRFGSAVDEQETFTESDEMSTVMILGLRMANGVEEEEFHKRFGKSMRDVFAGAIEKGVAHGLLEWDGGRLRLTRHGLMLSNEAMREFL